MPLTEEHRKNREGTLGSSDVPAIMGLSHYKTAYDVWAEQTGKVEPVDISDKPAVDFGVRAEPMILQWAEDKLGQEITRNVLVKDLDLHLSAQIDGVLASGNPVEVKAVGIRMADKWGDEGTDEFPDEYIIQCHVQMILAWNQVCHLAAYLADGRYFQMFRVQESGEISDQIKNEVGNFWTEYILADTPPPDSQPSPDVVKRLRREEGKSVLLGQDAVEIAESYWAAKKRESEAEAEAKALKTLLTGPAFLGDAEIGLFPEEAWINEKPVKGITYFKQTRRGLDQKALLADHPDAKDRWPKVSTFPVLRTRKG